MRKDAEMPDSAVDPSVFENSKAHRGIGTGEGASEIDIANAQREEMEFVPTFSSTTKFYSTSGVEELFNILLLAITKFSKDYTISIEDYSVQFGVIKDEKKIEVNANILKISKASSDLLDLHVLQFDLLFGDKFVFNEIYGQIREYF
eukprot:CAMPEP_0205808032 /NCGR_PEP_ID=MMETSP0205-20121125/11867_1 /ASSEMBLY_ACC=CAM_ASM_000278 /TAXON_ID=36767 /ORGANISM="Euplotes focardii, Strain TN1" /LENGTH=146 /DNA_ID=CAMNT_0053083067 /DNA_START=859 /DNA_END=1296 /DNA_ORIENTATION=+